MNSDVVALSAIVLARHALAGWVHAVQGKEESSQKMKCVIRALKITLYSTAAVLMGKITLT